MKKHLPPDGPVPDYSVWTFPLKFSPSSRWGCVAGCQDQLMLEFFFSLLFLFWCEKNFKIKLFIPFQVERKRVFLWERKKNWIFSLFGSLLSSLQASLPWSHILPLLYCNSKKFSLFICIMYLLFVFFFSFVLSYFALIFFFLSLSELCVLVLSVHFVLLQ